MYGRPRTAFFLGDGTVIVVDAEPPLARFDREGRFLGSMGQAGTGPGELRRVERAFALPDDRIMVVESNSPRAHVFAADGGFQEERSLAHLPGRAASRIGLATGDRWVVVDSESTLMDPAAGLHPVEPMSSVLVVDPDGAVDTVATFLGRLRYDDASRFASDQFFLSAVAPFASRPVVQMMDADRIIVADGRVPSIAVIDAGTGEVVQRIAVPPTSRRPTAHERVRWEERYLEGSAEVNRMVRPLLARIPNPTSRPPYDGVVWDAARRHFWASEYQSMTPWMDTLRVTVLPLEGSEPTKLALPGYERVLDIGDDALLVMHRSPLDVETVVRIPLRCR